MGRSTAKLVNRLTAMLVNCLTATLVNRLTAKLMVVNLVKLHLTKFNVLGINWNEFFSGTTSTRSASNAMWTLPSHYVYLQQFISECRCLIPCALNIHSDEVSVKTLQSFLFYCKVEMKKVPRILWNIWTPGLRKWNRTSLKSRLGIFSLKKVNC